MIHQAYTEMLLQSARINEREKFARISLKKKYWKEKKTSKKRLLLSRRKMITNRKASTILKAEKQKRPEIEILIRLAIF